MNMILISASQDKGIMALESFSKSSSSYLRDLCVSLSSLLLPVSTNNKLLCVHITTLFLQIWIWNVRWDPPISKHAIPNNNGVCCSAAYFIIVKIKAVLSIIIHKTHKQKRRVCSVHAGIIGMLLDQWKNGTFCLFVSRRIFSHILSLNRILFQAFEHF